MKTKIIYPDSLSCVRCGEVGLPIGTGGSFHYVGIMNRPVDGSPCFRGDIYGACPGCYEYALAGMVKVLTAWQTLRATVAQWWRPVEPLSRAWFAMTTEQKAAWVAAMEEVRAMWDQMAGVGEVERG